MPVASFTKGYIIIFVSSSLRLRFETLLVIVSIFSFYEFNKGNCKCAYRTFIVDHAAWLHGRTIYPLPEAGPIVACLASHTPRCTTYIQIHTFRTID